LRVEIETLLASVDLFFLNLMFIVGVKLIPVFGLIFLSRAVYSRGKDKVVVYENCY